MNKGLISGYGLIGYPLSHSWSEKFFLEKFTKENLHDNYYRLFPIEDISGFSTLLAGNPDLCGLNVTIPYKEKIIPFLDELDQKSAQIGAVNTIKIKRSNGKMLTKGYNTDVDGFILSSDFSGYSHAFILGTGGAAKAVGYALGKIGISFTMVSRKIRNTKTIGYQDLQSVQFQKPLLIINATPLGMYPDIDSCPEVPFDKLSPGDFLYDLVYNPDLTLFLKKGIEKGTRIQNGLRMLHIQAEESFDIWNNTTEF